ncbi:MAG TPA: 16S rRNA (guanine(527)-N(7))-methyltransferase RsmG [Streptosporangiaceae bacterium]
MSVPAVAREVFGDAFPVAERYALLLAGAGVERGLIGPREVDRLWDRHLLNCAVVGEIIKPGVAVIDVGSGAGLPGIVLAMVRPDLSITLLEPLLRRVTFLSECVSELGLQNITVRRARAEEAAGTLSGDVVTARAVAPLERLVRWALPLLRPGGELLAFKGERARTELDEAGPTLRSLGVRTAELLQLGHGKVEPPTTIVRVVAERSSGSVKGSKRGGRRRGQRGRKR